MRLLPRDLVCQQAVELVTDYLEGALGRRDRRRFESHLRACPNCRAYLEQIKDDHPAGRCDRAARLDSGGKGRSHRALPALAVRIARRDPNQALRAVGPSQYSDREGEVLCDAAARSRSPSRRIVSSPGRASARPPASLTKTVDGRWSVAVAGRSSLVTTAARPSTATCTVR